MAEAQLRRRGDHCRTARILSSWPKGPSGPADADCYNCFAGCAAATHTLSPVEASFGRSTDVPSTVRSKDVTLIWMRFGYRRIAEAKLRSTANRSIAHPALQHAFCQLSRPGCSPCRLPKRGHLTDLDNVPFSSAPHLQIARWTSRGRTTLPRFARALNSRFCSRTNMLVHRSPL